MHSSGSYRRTSPTPADSRRLQVFVHRIPRRLQYLAPEQSSETGVSVWLDRQFGTVSELRTRDISRDPFMYKSKTVLFARDWKGVTFIVNLRLLFNCSELF